MSDRYRPLKPGEKRPCWFCGGRKTVIEHDPKTKKVKKVTCSRCNGTGVQ